MADPYEGMAPGQAAQQKLVDGGFSNQDVMNWRDQQTQQLLHAGFKPSEVDDYWGAKPNMAPTAQLVQGNLAQGGQTASSWSDSFASGLQSSVTGLIARGQNPSIQEPQNDTLGQKVAFGAGEMLGDLPATLTGMIGGATAGTAIGGPLGGVIGGGAGANALPATMRQALMDHYASKGGPFTFHEFWQRTASVIGAGATAGAEGAVGAPLGIVGGNLVGAAASKVAGPGITAAASLTGDVLGYTAAATATGDAIQGKVPDSPSDFVAGAVLAVGFHVAGASYGATKRFVSSNAGDRVAENLRDTYAANGQLPMQVGARASTDIVVHNELIAPHNADGVRMTPAIDEHALSEPPPIKAPVEEKPEEEQKTVPSITTNEDGSFIIQRAGEKEQEVLGENEEGLIGFGAKNEPLAFETYEEAQAHMAREGHLGREAQLAQWGKDDEYRAAQEIALRAQGDNGDWMPDMSPEQPTEPANWTAFAKQDSDFIVARKLRDGTMVPDPHSIADYLQHFGKLAGFKFRVMDASHRLIPYRKAGEGPSYHHNGMVNIPDYPPELWNKYYGGRGWYEVLWHEVGHALDFHVLNSADRIYGKGSRKAFRDEAGPTLYNELLESSRIQRPTSWAVAEHDEGHRHYLNDPAELMADAVARYMSDPTARKNMPAFAARFHALLEPYINIAGRALPVKGTMGGGAWENPPPEEPIEPNYIPVLFRGKNENALVGGGGGKGPPSPPRKPPGRGPEQPRLPGPKQPEGIELNADMRADKILDLIKEEGKPEGWLNIRKLIAQFQGRLTPARNLDRLVGGFDPNQLSTEDMFRQTFASRDRAGHLIRWGGLRLDGDRFAPTDTPSLMDAFRAVKRARGNVKHFTAYMMAARTVEKARQGIETGVDFDLAREHIMDPEVRAKYDDAAKVMSKADDGLINYGVNSGIWSRGQGDAMKSANRYYIAFRRFIDPDYNPPRPGRGFGIHAAVRKMKGSQRQIVDPWTAKVDNYHTIVAMADRNRAFGHLIGLIESRQSEAERKQMQELLGLRKSDEQFAVEQETNRILKGQLQDENGNPLPEREAEALKPFLASRVLSKRTGGPDKFIYYRNGQMEVWEAHNPDVAELIKMSPTAAHANIISRLFRSFASLSRLGITGDPGFAFRAVTHGQMAQAAMAEHGTFPYRDIAAGIAHAFKQDEAYKQFVANGGAGAALADMDRDYIKSDIESLFNRSGTWDAVRNSVAHPFEAMRTFQHLLHAAAGIGYMKRVENKGFSAMKSALASRTAYLDHAEGFSQAWMNTLASWVPFMSIGFKDIEQMGSSFQRGAVQALVRGAVVMSTISVLNTAFNLWHDKDLPPDQQYRNLPRWERDSYWVLPPVNGVRVKIRKPYVASTIFSFLPERFTEYLATQNPRAFEGFVNELRANFVPPFIPSLATPIGEQYANEKFYNDQPLVPDALSHNNGYMQYNPDTSSAAKALARVLGPPNMNVANVSPIVLDNYFREWGGTLPMMAMHALDQHINPNARPLTPADNPWYGSFIVRNPGMTAQPIEDLRDAVHSFLAAHSDVVKALKEGNPKEVPSFEMQQAVVRVQGIERGLAGINQTLAAINQNKTMTDNEKLKWTDTILNQTIPRAQQMLTQLDAMKKGIK